MIYQKDWLMRQIESMIAAILHILTRTSESEELHIQLVTTEQLNAFLENGDICGAEDWIYENMEQDGIQWLLIAVEFYGKINCYSDEYLSAHNFSREEISSGLKYVTEFYGLGHII